MTAEVAAEVEKIMSLCAQDAPRTVALLWPDGDLVRFKVDRIIALTSKTARWRFGPENQAQTALYEALADLTKLSGPSS
jgi:hypothetical protein